MISSRAILSYELCRVSKECPFCETAAAQPRKIGTRHKESDDEVKAIHRIASAGISDLLV